MSTQPNNSWQRELVASETHLGAVGGAKVKASATLVRPANTNAVSAKDIVGSSLAITGATNATPIVVTCDAHTLADGDPVTIASVGGNTNANGSYFAKVTGYSTTTFGLYTDKALTTAKAGNSAYTSGGTVAKLFRFVNLARVEAGGGAIVRASLLTSQTTNTESFRLHLYSVPPAAILDEGVCTCPLLADAAKWGGTLDFAAAKTEGTGSTAAYASVALSGLPLPFICATSDRDLYGILESPTGFTAASGQTVTIALVAEVD